MTQDVRVLTDGPADCVVSLPAIPQEPCQLDRHVLQVSGSLDGGPIFVRGTGVDGVVVYPGHRASFMVYRERVGVRPQWVYLGQERVAVDTS